MTANGNSELTVDGARPTVDGYDNRNGHGVSRREVLASAAAAVALTGLPITPAEAENAALYVEAEIGRAHV